MVACLDHDEQVQRIGLEHRLWRQAFRLDVFDARGADLGFAPDRLLRRRRVNIIDQRLDARHRKLVGERRHLGGQSPPGDGLDRGGLAQPLQIFRQQCRPRAAETIGAVTGRAVRRVVLRGGGFRGGE